MGYLYRSDRPPLFANQDIAYDLRIARVRLTPPRKVMLLAPCVMFVVEALLTRVISAMRRLPSCVRMAEWFPVYG